MRPAVSAAFSLAALALVCGIPAAGAETATTVAAVTQAAPSPRMRDNAEQQARWFYSTLTGEIASRTGHPEVAYAELLRAARDMNSDDLFERAVAVALRAGHPHEALTAVDIWRDMQPRSLRAQAWRVHLLLGLRRDDDAVAATTRLLAMTPQEQRAQTVVALGEMLQGLHDPARALALARRSLSAYPSMPQAQLVIATQQVQAGQVPGGVALAARALKADPSLRQAAALLLQYYTVDPVRADRLLARYFDKNPADDALRLAWVESAAQQQRDSIALAQCRVLAQRQAGFAQVWLMLGSLQQQLGQAHAAETSLLRFLQLVEPAAPAPQPAQGPASQASQASQAPQAPVAAASAAQGVPQQDLQRVYVTLSELALQQGDTAGAARWLQRVGAAGSDVSVALQRARLLAAQGHARDAVDQLQALPRTSAAQRRQRLLALSDLLQGMHQPARAYAVLESGMRAWGRDADYAYETAMAAQQAGKVSRALALLRGIVRAHPRYQPGLNALGYTLADRGIELQQARALIERALRLSPGNPFVMDSLGWVEFRLGHLARARTLLEQALQGRDDPGIAAHLAEVEWRRGAPARARTLLRRAWRMAPHDPTVQRVMRRLGLKF